MAYKADLLPQLITLAQSFSVCQLSSFTDSPLMRNLAPLKVKTVIYITSQHVLEEPQSWAPVSQTSISKQYNP